MNTYTTGLQIARRLSPSRPTATSSSSGRICNGHDGSGDGIFGQRFDASGNRLGNEFLVNSYTTGDQSVPSVSMSPGGWLRGRLEELPGSRELDTRSSRGASMLRGTRRGTTSSSTPTRRARSSGYYGQVAHDAGGNFVVTWYGPGTAASAGPLASASALRAPAAASSSGSTPTPRASRRGRRSPPMPVGNFVVTWTADGQDGSGVGIFAQRFGGLAPAALAVDAAGNLVLEPGETVDVRPAWRNFNGATQTFSGTLTNISGPAGADLCHHRWCRRLRRRGQRSDSAVLRLLRGLGVRPRHAPGDTLGRLGGGDPCLPGARASRRNGGCTSAAASPTSRVTSGFYRFVEMLLHHGVTTGCTPTLVLPAAVRPRASKWPSSS